MHTYPTANTRPSIQSYMDMKLKCVSVCKELGQFIIKCALLTFKVFFKHNNVVGKTLAANKLDFWSQNDPSSVVTSYFTIQHKVIVQNEISAIKQLNSLGM